MQQRPDIQRMHDRLKAAFKDPEVFKLVHEDLIHTFEQLGLDARFDGVIARIVTDIQESMNLEETERKIFAELNRLEVGDKSVVQILDEKLKGRAEIIYGQVLPYFQNYERSLDPILDFGCGDGQVTQLLHDRLHLGGIVGCDVRDYRAQGVTIPILQFDGSHVETQKDGWSRILMTNVAHHEANNGKILQELSRILHLYGRLIVIETVPVADEPHEFERTFVGDYVYNRLFHLADVPVPGTYETTGMWVSRFEDVGFELEHMEDLGYDQPTIRDWHVLYVFKRTE